MSQRGPILSLILDGHHLSACSIPGGEDGISRGLATDPLHGDPALVATELRDLLKPLGGKWRRAVVGLPLNALRVSNTPIPAIAAEALPDFLQLEAERDFLLAPEEMAWAYTLSANTATLVALPAVQLQRLTQALAGVGVRELAVMPTPLMASPAPALQARLLVGSQGIDLAVTEGERTHLLRRLLNREIGAANQPPDPQSLSTALRLSQAQIPPAVAATLQTWRVEGPTHRVEPVLQALRAALPLLTFTADEDESTRLEMTACREAATRWQAGEELPLRLHRPVVSRPGVEGSQRRLGIWLGAAAVILVLAVVAAFWQQWRTLTRLQDEAARVGTVAAGVRTIVEAAKQEGPWHRDGAETLDAWMVVADAFPAAGDVWVTRMEVIDRQQLRLAGKAASRAAWLATVERLRQTPGVSELRVTQTQESADGSAPLNFVLTLNWAPPRGPAATPTRPQTDGRLQDSPTSDTGVAAEGTDAADGRNRL